MIKPFVILLAFVFALPGAQAGVRIINNGGGFAEMRALTAFARLRFLVAPCVSRPELCGLSDKELIFLSAQVKSDFFNTDLYEMEFFTDDPGVVSRRSSDRKILINSRALYDDSEQPKSYQEIARLVFVAWYGDFAGDIVPDLSKKIFNRFLVRENEVQLEVEGRVLRTYTMQSVVDVEQRDAILVYETPDGSRELTPMLVEALKCPESPRVLDISGFNYEHPIAKGAVTWICRGAKKQAHFAVHTSIVHITVFNEKSCEDGLI